MNIFTPIQSFSRAWSRRSVDAEDLQNFKSALDEMFDSVMDGQAEQTQRKFFTTFMFPERID